MSMRMLPKIPWLAVNVLDLDAIDDIPALCRQMFLQFAARAILRRC